MTGILNIHGQRHRAKGKKSPVRTNPWPCALRLLPLFVLLPWQCLLAQFPFQEKGKTDYFGIYLYYSSGEEADKVFVKVTDVANPGFVRLEDGVRMVNAGSINLYTFSSDGYLLSKDGRPLDPLKGVYVDFPLGLEIVTDDTYRFTCTTVSKELALAVLLVDKSNPGLTIDLLNGDHSLQLAPGKYTDRFILRVFTAEVLKPTATAALWNDPAAWMMGRVPASTSHVVIPEGAKVTIPQGMDITAGWLSNWGGELHNEGKLTVTRETEIRNMELP